LLAATIAGRYSMRSQTMRVLVAVPKSSSHNHRIEFDEKCSGNRSLCPSGARTIKAE
jgi:hypothetical protein